MIQINCTNCKSLLQIDDAFAGGVCRCRYCGTIQTVPKRLKKTSSVAAGGAPADPDNAVAAATDSDSGSSSPKAIFTRKGGGIGIETAGSGTGLDDLAEIVASSGLTSNRLQKPSTPPAAPSEPKTLVIPFDRRTMILLGSFAGVIVLLLGIIVVLALRGGGSGGGTPAPSPNPDPSRGQAVASGAGTDQGAPPAGVPQTPTFLGQEIKETSVVFVIDRGASSGWDGKLDAIKSALLNTLKRMGPERQFQVVFWGFNKQAPVTYPPAGTRPANAENIAELQSFMDNSVYPIGDTEYAPAVKAALKSKPEAVVLIPMKGIADDQLQFSSNVITEWVTAGKPSKFYCFSIGNTDWAKGLRHIVDNTGGAYNHVPVEHLHRFANP